MSVPGREFAVISIGAAIAAVLEIAALSALIDFDSLAPLALGLALAIGQAAWAATARLGGRTAWGAAGTAAVAYVAIVVLLFAIAMSNAGLQ